MILRVVLLLAAAALGIGVWWAIRQGQLRRAARLSAGAPAVVYFWSEECVPCRLVQTPVLDDLRRLTAADQLRIESHNVITEPELARRWRVLTLPTTFVVDRRGRPRFVNNGVADTAKLRRQLAAV